MTVDFIMDGVAHGPVANVVNSGMDLGLYRPFLDEKDRACCIITNRFGNKEIVEVRELVANGLMSPVMNATSLRKEEWIKFDEQVLRAYRYRTRAWADLAGANSYGGFNGIGTTVLEHETVTDPGEAVVDMDGLANGRGDVPTYQLQGLPLPITHMDFFLSRRQLEASRNLGQPLNTFMAEVAGRRVAESIEKTTIGTNTGITYGGTNTAGTYGRTSAVYGYTNFPNRVTYATMRNPANTVSYTPSMTLADVLALIDLARANKCFGPFMLYTSNDWDKYLDTDYILTGGNVATQTLRNRIRSIDDIIDVRRLDFMFATAPTQNNSADKYDNLNPFTMILVQMTPDVCRAVNALDLTTIQWESKGGWQLNFKVMAIQVPQLRADAYGNCGIIHGTCSS